MYKVGITGNYYFTSINREDLISICILIDKSIKSIYYNTKYSTWVIRIKNKHTKDICKELFKNNKNNYK